MITTIQGSATSPRPGKGKGAIIAHLCNDLGKWGAGFVLAVNDLSTIPKSAYHALSADFNAGLSDNTIPRGIVQFVQVFPPDCDGQLIVANMVAQNGVNRSAMSDGCMVDYPSLDTCLHKVMWHAVRLGCDVHIPKGMGSGLAGGDQNKIIDMITHAAQDVEATSRKLHGNFDASINITLWEFVDTSAKSYIPTSKLAEATEQGSNILDGLTDGENLDG